MPPRSIKRKRTKIAVNNKGKSSTIAGSQTSTPDFSYDIWFEILSWLPATLLCNIMSRVCKTLATMIRQPHFVQTNLHRSKSGMVNFLDNRGYLYGVDLYSSYLEARCLKVDIRCLLTSTSQGLCVFYDYSTDSYYVINPVTMQRAKISGTECLIPPHTYISYSAVCDRRSGEVKLVLACVDSYNISSWYVQILGAKNSWKKISAGHQFGRLDFPGISIAGFLIYVGRKHIVVVLDVSVETVHKIDSPRKVGRLTYLQMGKDALSCISLDGERIFIHVLNEFVAGNWSLYKIVDYRYIPPNVSLKIHRFIGWIGEELLLRFYKQSFTNLSSGLSRDEGESQLEETWEHYTYNLKTKKITSLRGIGPSNYFGEAYQMWVHTPSLLSWKTLQA